MRTPFHLETLRRLKIWHDNSGKGGNQNWHLNMVKIDDFKEKRRFVMPLALLNSNAPIVLRERNVFGRNEGGGTIFPSCESLDKHQLYLG